MPKDDAGWLTKASLPKDRQKVRVKGSDFMGEWESEATFRITNPNGPRHKWIGSGFMGTKPRQLENSDVEFWQPLPAAPSKES